MRTTTALALLAAAVSFARSAVHADPNDCVGCTKTQPPVNVNDHASAPPPVQVFLTLTITMGSGSCEGAAPNCEGEGCPTSWDLDAMVLNGRSHPSLWGVSTVYSGEAIRVNDGEPTAVAFADSERLEITSDFAGTLDCGRTVGISVTVGELDTTGAVVQAYRSLSVVIACSACD